MSIHTLSLSLATTARGALLLSEGPMTTLGGVMLLDVDIEWWTDINPLWGDDVRRCKSDDPGVNLELDDDDNEDDDVCFDTWPVAPTPIWTWLGSWVDDELDSADRELLPLVIVTGTWVFEMDLEPWPWDDCGELWPAAEADDDMDEDDMRATRGRRGGAAEEEVLMWGGMGGEELPTSDKERVGAWWWWVWWWEWWLCGDGTLARMFRMLGFCGLNDAACLKSKHTQMLKRATVLVNQTTV